MGAAGAAGWSGSIFEKRLGTAESAFKFWGEAVAGAAILDKELSETDELIRDFAGAALWRGRKFTPLTACETLC